MFMLLNFFLPLCYKLNCPLDEQIICNQFDMNREANSSVFNFCLSPCFCNVEK